jgi:hypothetical protein
MRPKKRMETNKKNKTQGTERAAKQRQSTG